MNGRSRAPVGHLIIGDQKRGKAKDSNELKIPPYSSIGRTKDELDCLFAPLDHCREVSPDAARTDCGFRQKAILVYLIIVVFTSSKIIVVIVWWHKK